MTIKNLRDQTISKWLKAELKRKGMSPGELAEKITATGNKIGRATMYYYVSGQRLPSADVAVALGLALGSPVPEYAQRPVGRPIKPHVDVRKLILPDVQPARRPRSSGVTA